MGLIRAAIGATGGTFADQWKEYFYCDALPNDVLMAKGERRISGRSSNYKGNDNIISNGSVIAVADGQCMMIVEQGKVVEVCAEPGEFTYDTSTEPSIFCGSLGEGISNVFATIGKRFAFGGEAPNDQRIYYFNTREIMGNKYGTPNPIIFKIVDKDSNFRVDMPIRCFGEYSYRIANPLLFYTNLSGNVADYYTRDELDSQMKSELLTHLQPAFAKLSQKGISYSELMGHTLDIRDALKEELSELWGKGRGIEIVNFGVSSMKGDEKVEEKLRNIQLYRNDPSALAAEMGAAQAAAMQMAAANEGAGAPMAFMGMGMAGQMGTGMNVQNLYQMGQQQQAAAPAAPAQAGWVCSCGHAGNTGKFCSECGKPQPVPVPGWTCSCGAVNKGKFCSECGKPKPAGVPQYKCDKCGWEPEDPAHPPKFCPECGDPFDDGDLK